MDYFLILLLPLSAWRLYRLLATDTGYKEILRKFRILLGVKYKEKYNKKSMSWSVDYTQWTTNDGSLAELVTCCWCSTLWWGIILTLLMLYAPLNIYLLVVLPLNVSAVCLFWENKIFSKEK